MEEQIKAFQELLKTKDEEIVKLSKIKDMMREQLTKVKEENNHLKEDLEKAKIAAEKNPATIYPDLEKKLKQTEDQLKSLEDANKKLTEDLAKSKSSSSASPTSATEKKDEKKSEVSGDSLSEDAPIPMDTLLKQVKTGMFKLGQQNFSIEQKIDSLLELLSTGAGAAKTPMPESPGMAMASNISIKKPMGEQAAIRKPSEMMKPAKAEEAVSAPAPVPEEEVHVRKPSAGFAGRKPSDLAKAKAEEDAATAAAAAPKEEEVHTRRPSGTSSRMAAPEVKIGAPAEAAPAPTPAPAPAAPMGGGGISKPVRTVPYPADGILKCPNCNAQNFAEMENKAKIISFVPVKKYGKMRYCKNCRTQWDYDKE